MDNREELAKLFWQRVSTRQVELHYTGKYIESETENRTGKKYRFTESKCRNVIPDSYTICTLAEILQTTTDYLLGFIDTASEANSKELRILETYRTNKYFRAVIDNAFELIR